MAGNVQVKIELEAGGEATIAAMDEYSRMEIGRKTYRFAREVMRNPELRAMVKARTAERLAEQAKAV